MRLARIQNLSIVQAIALMSTKTTSVISKTWLHRCSACNYDDMAQVDDGSCDYCCGYDVFTSTEAGYVSIDLVQTHTSGDLAG